MTTSVARGYDDHHRRGCAGRALRRRARRGLATYTRAYAVNRCVRTPRVRSQQGALVDDAGELDALPPHTSNTQAPLIGSHECECRRVCMMRSRDLRNRQRATALHYTDRLRLLALNDIAYVDRLATRDSFAAAELDAKLLALARLGALIATGGSGASYGVESDEALATGATPEELVGVLHGVASIVGIPRVVTAAPTLALALGYDVDAALEGFDDPRSSRSGTE
jgi:4-carboxymuconolactone decarboxylase